MNDRGIEMRYRKIMCAISLAANVIICLFAVVFFLLSSRFSRQCRVAVNNGSTHDMVYSYSDHGITINSRNNGDVACYVGGKYPILFTKYKNGEILLSIGELDHSIMHFCDKNGCVTNFINRNKLAAQLFVAN